MPKGEIERPDEPRDPTSLVLITGSVVMTEKDFTNVWLALPHVKRLLLSLTYLVFGLSLAGWAGIFEEQHRYAIAVIIALLGIAGLCVGSNKTRREFARQSLLQMGRGGRLAFCFDASGYSVETGSGEEHFDWANALAAVETPEAFVIYNGPREFLIVPKRSFEHYKLPDLRELISSFVPIRRSGKVTG